jgi:hypothetical protein
LRRGKKSTPGNPEQDASPSRRSGRLANQARVQSIRQILLNNKEKPKRASRIIAKASQSFERNLRNRNNKREISVSPSISSLEQHRALVDSPTLASPTFEIHEAQVECVVLRVKDGKRKTSRLMRIDVSKGVIVDEDEATFKCEEMEDEN